MKFSHGGAAGDVLYHLAVVKEVGGGEFYLRHSITPGVEPASMQALLPLLEIQPYITKTGWVNHPVFLNLDGWRNYLDFNFNLTDMLARWLGMGHVCGEWPHKEPPIVNQIIPHDCPPWIVVDRTIEVAPVVINRTPRHNYAWFPWHSIYQTYGKKSVFVGLPEEHRLFEIEFGQIPYYPTKDFLEAARVIAGSKLYIGTGSGLTALCEGMKHRCIVSSFPEISHAIFFNRPGQQHCWDKVNFWEV